MRYAVLVISLLFAARAHAQEACAQCHRGLADPHLSAPALAQAGDAHDVEGAGCHGCHGGNPEEPSARAHDLSAGFVGRPTGLAVAMLCTRCHDEEAIDDGEAPIAHAYGSSAHARALADGRAAPTCTSCHGAHGIERIPRARVTATCGACHASERRMEGSGLPTDQVRQWTLSVHGRAAHASREAPAGDGGVDAVEAPVCSSCHDAHAARAGLAAVRACGECHAAIRGAFDEGPHGARFDRLGFLDCAECHGSHEVAPPDRLLLLGLDATCSRCHGEGREELEVVRRIAAHADELDRARATLPRDDPRREAAIVALHALDAEALDEAVAALPPAPAPPPPEAPPAPRAWIPGTSIAIGIAALGVVAVWLIHRGRRA